MHMVYGLEGTTHKSRSTAGHIRLDQAHIDPEFEEVVGERRRQRRQDFLGTSTEPRYHGTPVIYGLH